MAFQGSYYIFRVIDVINIFQEQQFFFDSVNVSLPGLNDISSFRNAETAVLICAARWVTFKPKFKKMKKSRPEKKNSFILGNGTFLPPKKLYIFLKKILAPKNLKKTSLGETGCLSNH